MQPPKVTRVRTEPTNGRHPTPIIRGAKVDAQTRLAQIAATAGLLLSGWVQVVIAIMAVLRAVVWERGNDE